LEELGEFTTLGSGAPQIPTHTPHMPRFDGIDRQIDIYIYISNVGWVFDFCNTHRLLKP
jgi:hypothetical protein